MILTLIVVMPDSERDFVLLAVFSTASTPVGTRRKTPVGLSQRSFVLFLDAEQF